MSSEVASGGGAHIGDRGEGRPDGGLPLGEVTRQYDSRAKRILDYLVAFRWIAAAGSLTAAITPAVIATADGTTLRGSVSAYWNVEPRYSFWLPLTIAGVLLCIDGVISYVSPNWRDYGGRWFNIVLGAALVTLTWFDLDNDPVVHYIAAYLFFGLFIVVIAYTSFLGWRGVHLDEFDQPHDRAIERASARVSGVFLGLLLLTLGAWLFGLISFYFFEIFALVNFALYYVQGSVYPFPYAHYEFPYPALNRIFRTLGIMRRLPAGS